MTPAAVRRFVCRWRAVDESDVIEDVNDSHS